MALSVERQLSNWTNGWYPFEVSVEDPLVCSREGSSKLTVLSVCMFELIAPSEPMSWFGNDSSVSHHKYQCFDTDCYEGREDAVGSVQAIAHGRDQAGILATHLSFVEVEARCQQPQRKLDATTQAPAS